MKTMLLNDVDPAVLLGAVRMEGVHQMLEGVIDVLLKILLIMLLLLMIAGIGMLIAVGFVELTRI